MDRKLRNKLLLSNNPPTSRSQPSSPLIGPSAAPAASSRSSLSRLGLSPLRGRKSYQSNNDDPRIGIARWPSSTTATSSTKQSPINSLADYLGDDRINDRLDAKISSSNNGSNDKSTSYADGPQLLSRTQSYMGINRFEEKGNNKDKKEEEEEGRKISKENRPFGGSMRYIGKLRFPKSSHHSSSPTPSILQPGRMSVDLSVLTSQRKKTSSTDFGIDIPSNESERSDITASTTTTTKGMSPRIPRARNKDVGHKSLDRTPAAKLAAAAVRRTSSGSGLSQWALSPGRQSSSPQIPPLAAKPVANGGGGGTPTRSFSSLRPGSPDHHHKSSKKGSLISMGLDLFRRKSGLGLGSGSGSINNRPASPVILMGDVGHQFRMLHNSLMQWRYLNARADSIQQTRTNTAENTLISAWVEIARMHASVMQKKVRLRRENLNLKLNRLLSWQMKSLEGWGDIERQHNSALSTTQNCLQAAIIRLPLVDRAKADPQILSIRLRQVTNLTAAIQITFGTCQPAVQNTVPLLSALAQVVAEEKTQLEECVEMLGQLCALQIQEQSLWCHLVQLKSSQQQRHLNDANLVMT